MLAAFVDGNLSLPFGGLITHIFAHLGIELEEGEPVITSIASFDKKTIANLPDKLSAILGDKLHLEIQTLPEHPQVAPHPSLKMLCP
jgi:hypothetical protein